MNPPPSHNNKIKYLNILFKNQLVTILMSLEKWFLLF